MTTDAAATAGLILELCELAIERRRRALAPAARDRAEVLEQELRDLIDGARLAPRRIEGHAAGQVRAAAPAAPAPPAASLGAPPPAAKRPGMSLGGMAEALELSVKDRAKLKGEIRLEDLPRSAYTPSIAPTFLGDWYDDDVLPFAGATDVPRSMRSGDLVVPAEVRVLFGLGEPGAAPEPSRSLRGSEPHAIPVEAPRTRPEPPASPAPPAAPAPHPPRASLPPATSVSASSPLRGRPVIVHLMTGSVRRGQLEQFEPSRGELSLVQDDGTVERLPLDGVLAVFFAMIKGEEVARTGGQRVVVRLVNDRQVVGITRDYREGGDSLTISPEQRRGNVDRIWIPAWAVKEIQLG